MPTTVAPAILRVDDLTEMLGVCRKTIWSWRRSGLFPEPTVRLGPRLIAWRRSDIDAWLADHPTA